MILLDNCLVFDGVSAELADGRAILIEDGIIREIGKAGRLPGKATVLDLGGRFVMPGLIDAHFHSYWYEWDGRRIDATSPQLRILHAKRQLEGTLRRGFTTVRDAGGGDVHLAEALRLGLIDGPRFCYPGQALTQSGGHADLREPAEFPASGTTRQSLHACPYSGAMSRVVDGPEEMRRVVREHLRQGATHIKLHTSGGPTASEHDPVWYTQFSEEEIRVAVSETSRRRAYVMAHAHSNDAAKMCARNGVRSIEHVSLLEADGARELVENGAFAVPTLAILGAIVHIGPSKGLGPAWTNAAASALRSALGSLELLHAAGAKIGFGTDLCGVYGDQQLTEFRLRSDVLPALDILRSATSVNAELIQRAGDLGTIAVGARADILAIDGNPLDDIAVLENPARMAMIMRGGELITAPQTA
ncbi:metal-dependent hydrolase family protein [Amycolatopsis pigmentata]|uniref:Amidohydrolase family protein n=1 Tax=Amycolatopsis pigmentata TaxID=450801 RepID=A0ABW5FQ03_9PSEU